jgi:hypothetical protein
MGNTEKLSEKLSEELRGANAVVYLAARAYKPGAYSGRVALFRSGLEPMSLHRDTTLGWKDVATQMVVEEVPGDHREIFDDPAVRVLAAQLSEQLEHAPTSSLAAYPASHPDNQDAPRVAVKTLPQRVPQGTL